MAAVDYHSGSATISLTIYDELSDVLDRLATLSKLILLVSDVHIWRERLPEPPTLQLNEALATHSLTYCATGSTHDLGRSKRRRQGAVPK